MGLVLLTERHAEQVADWAAAQKLSDSWDASRWHRKLDEFADRDCPILKRIEESYHWSLAEAEHATDIVFRRQANLEANYGQLIRTAINTVQPEQSAARSTSNSRNWPSFRSLLLRPAADFKIQPVSART